MASVVTIATAHRRCHALADGDACDTAGVAASHSKIAATSGHMAEAAKRGFVELTCVGPGHAKQRTWKGGGGGGGGAGVRTTHLDSEL